MSYINRHHNINTLDEIWATTRKTWTVGLDGNRFSEIYVVAFDPATGTGLARSYQTHQWFALQITGKVIRHGQVRVALYPLVDASLADGTLLQGKQRIGGRVASTFMFGNPVQATCL